MQDPACTAATGYSGRQRVVPTSPAPRDQGAARSAHAQTEWALQLLRSEREPPLVAATAICRGAHMAEVARPKEPACAHVLEAVCGGTRALPASTPADQSPDLGSVAARRLGRRAGWWKSPRPDLVRAPAGKPAGATLQVGQSENEFHEGVSLVAEQGTQLTRTIDGRRWAHVSSVSRDEGPSPRAARARSNRRSRSRWRLHAGPLQTPGIALLSRSGGDCASGHRGAHVQRR